jgi:hypothetical protein
MRRLPIVLAGLAAASIALAACSAGAASPRPAGPQASGGPACQTAPAVGDVPGWGQPATAPSVIPVPIANPGELVCGPNRFLFSFVDPSGRPVGSPDRTASLAVYDLARDPATPITTVQGTFIWAIQDERGIYVANVTFPEAGRYGAEFRTAATGGQAEAIRMTFDVETTNGVVKVGQPAPASKTPTLADVGGDPSRISTDANPDPAFYRTSVDQALVQHQPFVLIFATPKFCTSAQCGPTLDRLKPYAARYPSITFIHVEPYKLRLDGGTLAAERDAQGGLVPTEATDQWGLLSEPWVFVVDRTGIVRGSFELMFSDAELTTELDAVK